MTIICLKQHYILKLIYAGTEEHKLQMSAKEVLRKYLHLRRMKKRAI
jgi:hypothetical protein